jgi:hypothetical protein
MNRLTMLGLLIGLAVVAAPLIASAQNIDVTPEGWDYGNVKVGLSSTVIFTITCLEITPLTFESATIVDDATGSFSITSAAPPPAITLFQGELVDITVEFTPSGLGAHSASLYIDSDAEPPRNNLYLPLEGVGVERWRCVERIFPEH